jgi:hypothetical protein
VSEYKGPFIIVIHIKASRAISLKMRNKYSVKLKKGGTWKKTFNRMPVNDMALVGSDKAEAPLYVVLKAEQSIPVAEVGELTKIWEVW